ncbi:MAG: CPBP family intramembrane metalloprotease [Anaerolineae bacterium]|nr:CPBP family intramembrane metalloprotease [Anaerolineae bacterium]
MALAFIVLLDGAYLVGGPQVRAFLERAGAVWSACFLALPLADVAASRGSPSALGYRRAGWWRWYLWGALAGAVWRLLDILLVLPLWGPQRWPGLGPLVAWGAWLWNALVMVPLLEETFFRGYLQEGLGHFVPPWAAIVTQAALFASHPWHLTQGWVHWPSIFLFGLATGWLRWRTGSLAGPWGAHGMANILPELLLRAAAALGL